MNAYIIGLGEGQNYKQNVEFSKAFDALNHRVPVQGMQNTYLAWSDKSLQDWYGYFGSATQSEVLPLIVPIDTNRLATVQTLPGFFRGFLDHEKSKAA